MYSHGSATKPSRRVTWVHWSIWGVTAAIVTLLFLVTRNPWLFGLIPVGVIAGLPLKADLTWYHLLSLDHEARRLRRKEGGVMVSAPLRRDPDAPPRSKIEQVRRTLAAVQEAGGTLSWLPLLTDPTGNYLTMVFSLRGASDAWVSADASGRFFQDLNFLDALGHALSSTRERTLALVQGMIYRSADFEPAYMYSRGRLHKMVAAAAQAAEEGRASEYSEVDVTLGTHAIARLDSILPTAGGNTYYSALRMPWPKRGLWRTKVDLTDPKAFRKSRLHKTIREMVAAYQAQGIEVRFLSDEQLGEFFSLAIHSTELRSLRYFWQRNRALTELRGEPAPEQRDDLPMPVTVDCDTDGSGWIRVGQTYVAAGYATAVKRLDLPSGFQHDLIEMPPDVAHNFATWNDLTLVIVDELRSAGKELGVKALHRQLPLEHLSDPRGDMRVQEIERMRRRLAETGGRSSDAYHLFVVMGRSPEDLEEKWEDAITKAGRVYDIQRVTRPRDIEDVLLAQIGVKID